MQLRPCRRVLCRAFSSPKRCGEMQRLDSASIILTAVTAVLFVHFFKASVLEGYGFTKQSWCSQWYNCPDIAMPAALGTVGIRGSACEGKRGRKVCDAGRVNPQGTDCSAHAGGRSRPLAAADVCSPGTVKTSWNALREVVTMRTSPENRGFVVISWTFEHPSIF